MSMNSAAEMTAEFAAAIGRDVWVPANGGHETEFLARSGARLLYVWNGKSRKHAYLDLGTDIILSDEEAFAHLGTV